MGAFFQRSLTFLGAPTKSIVRHRAGAESLAEDLERERVGSLATRSRRHKPDFSNGCLLGPKPDPSILIEQREPFGLA